MADETNYNDPTGLEKIDYDQEQVSPEVKKYTKNVRHKMYGRHVRESIARAIEVIDLTAQSALNFAKKAFYKSEDTENRLDNQIRDLTSDSEIIDLRYSKMLKKTFDILKDRGDFWDESIEHLNGSNIEWFREYGMSDTDLLKKVITENKNIYIPGKTYNFDVTQGPIEILSNSTIIFNKNTEIKVIENDLESYRLFSIDNGVENISLIGNWATLTGDKDDHLGDLGEWGRLISLGNCSDVFIDELNLNKSWGDGLYVGGKGFENKSRNIVIGELKFDENRRQGMSVINVDGLDVDMLTIKNTFGTSPCFGVDFEPNHSDEVLKNIRIKYIDSSNNEGGAVLFALRQMANRNNEENISIKIDKVKSYRDGVPVENNTSRFLDGKLNGRIDIDVLETDESKKQVAKFVNHSESNEKFSIRKVYGRNPNRSNLQGKEAYSLYVDSPLSGLSVDNIDIGEYHVYSDYENVKGVYYNSPEGVNLQIGLYNPQLHEKTIQNPSNVLHFNRGNSSKRMSFKYLNPPIFELANVENPQSVMEAICYTNVGRSVRLPDASRCNGLGVRFTSGNSEQGQKLVTVRVGDNDKILTEKGIVEGNKSLVLSSDGAFYTLYAFMGYWRLRESSGNYQINN